MLNNIFWAKTTFVITITFLRKGVTSANFSSLVKTSCKVAELIKSVRWTQIYFTIVLRVFVGVFLLITLFLFNSVIAWNVFREFKLSIRRDILYPLCIPLGWLQKISRIFCNLYYLQFFQDSIQEYLIIL